MRTREIDTRRSGSMQLPPAFRGRTVFVNEFVNTLIIKRSPVTDLRYVREKLKNLKTKISQKDIEQAVKAARRK